MGPSTAKEPSRPVRKSNNSQNSRIFQLQTKQLLETVCAITQESGVKC